MDLLNTLTDLMDILDGGKTRRRNADEFVNRPYEKMKDFEKEAYNRPEKLSLYLVEGFLVGTTNPFRNKYKVNVFYSTYDAIEVPMDQIRATQEVIDFLKTAPRKEDPAIVGDISTVFLNFDVEPWENKEGDETQERYVEEDQNQKHNALWIGGKVNHFYSIEEGKFFLNTYFQNERMDEWEIIPATEEISPSLLKAIQEFKANPEKKEYTRFE